MWSERPVCKKCGEELHNEMSAFFCVNCDMPPPRPEPTKKELAKWKLIDDLFKIYLDVHGLELYDSPHDFKRRIKKKWKNQ